GLGRLHAVFSHHRARQGGGSRAGQARRARHRLNLITAITLPILPRMARVARASTLGIVAMPFIDAARAAGYSHKRIILRHIIPNIVAPYLIMVSASMAQAILLEASL